MTKFEQYIDNILRENYFFVEKDKNILLVVPKDFKNHEKYQSLQPIIDYKTFKESYNHWKNFLKVLNHHQKEIPFFQNEFINYYQKEKIKASDKEEFLEDLYSYIDFYKIIRTITKCSFENIEDKIKIAIDMDFYPKILEDLKPIALEYSTNMEDFYILYFKRKKDLIKKQTDFIYHFLEKEFGNNVEKINPILDENPVLKALFNNDVYLEGMEEKYFDIQFEISPIDIHKHFPNISISTLEFYITSFTEEYTKVIDYQMKLYKGSDNGKNQLLFLLKDTKNSSLFQWKEYKKILLNFLEDYYFNEDKYYSKNGLIRDNIKIFIRKNLLENNIYQKQQEQIQKLKI